MIQGIILGIAEYSSMQVRAQPLTPIKENINHIIASASAY